MTERLRCGLQGPEGSDGHPVVEGMSERDLRLDEPGAQVVKDRIGEKRRQSQQRVGRRADIVTESGQRQFLGAASSACRGSTFDHMDRQSGARQGHRCSEPVRARTDDNCVELSHRAATAAARWGPKARHRTRWTAVGWSDEPTSDGPTGRPVDGSEAEASSPDLPT